MAGLISNTLDNGVTAYGAETAPYDPTLRTIDPAKETVAGQLNSILSSGSPVLQNAQAGAMDAANSRGLLNSSIAAGAGEKAMIESALPIANADANVYGTASRDNQAFQNNAGQFNAGAKNTSNLNLSNAANASEQAQQSADIQTGQILPATTAAQSQLQREGAEQKSALLTQQGGIETALQQLKGGQAEQLANIEANYKTLIQTSASASDVYKTAMAQISNIFADTSINAAAKANIINGQLGWLRQQMNLIGSVNGVDLTGLTDFGTVTAGA